MSIGAITRSGIAGLAVLALGSSLAWGGCESPAPGVEADSTAAYEQRPKAAPGGTGRFYLGREIAAMTDHDLEAERLERPEREAAEFPGRLVQALDLGPADVVADIGAGTGYFTFRLSPLVPEGRVLAVDIQEGMLSRIRQRIAAEGVDNVEPVLGTQTDPNLPANSVDVALIVVSYHEFSHPREMIEHVVQALKHGGRLVLVEYRGEDPTLPVEPVHTMTEAQARKEMQAVGLVWVETKDVLPQQHLMVFQKPAAPVP